MPKFKVKVTFKNGKTTTFQVEANNSVDALSNAMERYTPTVRKTIAAWDAWPAPQSKRNCKTKG